MITSMYKWDNLLMIREVIFTDHYPILKMTKNVKMNKNVPFGSDLTTVRYKDNSNSNPKK